MRNDKTADHEITLDFRQLSLWERHLLISLLYGHQDNHPLTRYALRQTQRQLQMLCRFLAATLRLTFPNLLRDINHHGILLKREELYQNLVLAGTPKKALRKMFAKSVRDIERDRAAAGMGGGNRGRPGKIIGQKAYEVMGRWHALRETEPDLASCLLLLHEDFRGLPVGSLYNLVTDN